MNSTFLKKVTAALLAATMILGVATGCSDSKEEVASVNEADTASVAQPTASVLSKKVSHSDVVKLIESDLKINDKVSAYLSVPGTNINYPIVHNSEEDNNYYVDMTLDGSIAGADYHNIVDTVVYAAQNTSYVSDAKEISQGSANYVMFGHNWNNIREPFVIGNEDPETYSMFAELPSFTDQEFAQSNPYIYLDTAEYQMIFKVFAVMYTEDDWGKSGVDFNYIQPDLSNSQKSTFYNECLNRSMWDYGDVEVAPSDIFVTLSTCTRYYDGGGDKQRFVVVGRMLREGEDDTADTTTVYEHISAVEPAL